MNTAVPYRIRCGGQGDMALCGYNHKRAAEIVDSWYNSTSPLPLAQPNAVYLGSVPACDCGETNGNNGMAGTDWQSAFFPGAGTGEKWQGSAQDLLTLQTYVKGDKIDLGQCHKYGFKNVAGRKYWFGRYGFWDADGCSDRTASPTGTKYRTIKREFTAHVYGNSGYKDFNRTDVCTSAGFVFTSEITGFDWTMSRKATFTVGEQTGIVTQTSQENNTGTVNSGAWTVTGGATTTFSNPPIDWQETISGTTFDATTGQATDSGGFIRTRNVCPPSGPATPVTFPVIDGANLSSEVSRCVTWANMMLTIDSNCQVMSSNGFGFTAWSQFIAELNNTQDGISGGSNVYGSVTTDEYSNVKMHLVWEIAFSQAAPTSGDGFYGSNTTRMELVIELSDPYAASAVQSDIEDNLLSTWPLNDDKIYPWRKDQWTNIMPLVIRREIQSNVNPDKKDFTVWTDPNAALGYDGAIIGSPLTAGYAGAFDFYFTDQRFCAVSAACITSAVYFEGYDFQYGGALTDVEAIFAGGPSDGAGAGTTISTGQYANFLPHTATHWPNSSEAFLTPRGAMIDMGTTTLANGGIVAVKWAEARCRPYESHNFARPCGFDRVAIDETTAQCVTTEVAGVSLVLSAEIPDPTGQTVLVAFTGGSNGLWTGCTQATVAGVTTLTLGSKISDLPTGYAHDFSDIFTTNGGLVGLVRWPTAPALCGRAAVTIADAGSSHTQITFATAQPNLRAGDALDFSKADMTATQSNVAVLTRTSDTVFIVDKAFADMTDTAWATSYGTDRKYFWNDHTFKGDYRYGGWTVDNRPVTPTTTFGGCAADCLPWDDCNPGVVCFSPNGETWNNGVTRWFGAGGLPSFVADGVYGARVQANVEFVVPDLLWQAPKVPCPFDGISFTAAMDAGACADDDIASNPNVLYYPPYPLIEARCDSSVLAGPARDQAPPAFAAGIAWPDMVIPKLPSSDALGEIGWGIGSFHLNLEPWTRYKDERATINANPACRFISFYEANYPMV